MQKRALTVRGDRPIAGHDFHENQERRLRTEVHQKDVGQVLIRRNLEADRCGERFVTLDDLVSALAQENDAGIFKETSAKGLHHGFGDHGTRA